MRCVVIVLLVLPFLCCTVTALSINTGDTYTVGDTLYIFNCTLKPDYLSINNTCIVIDDMMFLVNATGQTNITVNRLDNNESFDMICNASVNGTIYFDFAGHVFQREYYGKEITITIGEKEDTLSPIFLAIFVPVMIVMIGGMIIFFISDVLF